MEGLGIQQQKSKSLWSHKKNKKNDDLRVSLMKENGTIYRESNGRNPIEPI